MLIENIQEFRWVGAWNVFFCALLTCLLTKWPKWPDRDGTTGRTRGLQTKRSFSMMQDFRQSSEAVGLSQVSKMLEQLTGQISAHHSSSKIRNTHLPLFRTDQGQHTVPFHLTNFFVSRLQCFIISIHCHSFQFLGDLNRNEFPLSHQFFLWSDGQPWACSLNGEVSPEKSAFKYSL